MRPVPRLQLLTRPDCGLCDDAARVLASLGVEFDTIDVDQEEALRVRYGEAIPVILRRGREVARAPIEAGALKAALRRAGVRAGRV
jgi:glutaredoxin